MCISLMMLLHRCAMLSISMMCTMLAMSAYAGGPTIQNDRFTNVGSIANTRHNMTQNTAGGIGINMDRYRNQYGEVCVYCHTPHGSNQAAAAPLWNRTIKNTTYNTYNQLGTSTLTQTVRQPGGSSLTCLSCHDGQTAIDSIINMPGTWRNQTGQANQYSGANTTLSVTFLNAWNPPLGGGVTDATQHMGLDSTNGIQGDGAGSKGCLVCHSEGPGPLQGGLVNFTIFNIGTDLRNDHPVGVTFPTTNGPGTDWNTPINTPNNNGAKFFDRTDTGTIGKMDKSEIRIFAANKGGAVGAPSQTVECASCHDPHGVPDPSTGKFNPTFLRVNNLNSAVCLTCHTK